MVLGAVGFFPAPDPKPTAHKSCRGHSARQKLEREGHEEPSIPAARGVRPF